VNRKHTLAREKLARSLSLCPAAGHRHYFFNPPGVWDSPHLRRLSYASSACQQGSNPTAFGTITETNMVANISCIHIIKTFMCICFSWSRCSRGL